MDEILRRLEAENKELRQKLKKSEKRNRNLTNKIRKLKGLDKRGSLERKKYNNTFKQTDESIGNLRHPNRRDRFKFRSSGSQLRVLGRDIGSDLCTSEGGADSTRDS